MSNIYIDGIGGFDGGEYGEIRIDGIGKCQGSFKSDSLQVDGAFHCKGNIDTGFFECDGNVDIWGDLSADKIEIDGMVNIHGCNRIEADSICCEGAINISGHFMTDIIVKRADINGALSVRGNGKIEGDEIYCDGAVHIDGQISADIVSIDGIVTAREIVGDRITIDSLGKPPSVFGACSIIGTVEATGIELSGVTARTVNGSNIVIGPGCRISSIDCNGTISIDRSSIVNKITGDYTRT